MVGAIVGVRERAEALVGTLETRLAEARRRSEYLPKRRSGKPSRTRNSSSFPAPRRIFTLPARHCELNGPNLVSLSPLSRAGSTLKPLSAGTGQKAWFLPACRPQPFRYVWVANDTFTGVDKAAAAR